MSDNHYVAPPVEVGQMVHWYPDSSGSELPSAAIVTFAGQETIGVLVLPNGYHNGMPRDGVRHVGDPRAKEVELRENGCWTYTPATVRQHALEQRITELEEQVLTAPAK